VGIHVVSGSASGIGRAVAAMLIESGHTVIGIDLKNADLNVDLSSADGRASAVAQVHERTDVVDGIVPAAGLAGLPDRSGALVASVNFFGTVDLLSGLHPLLSKAADPAVVAIASNSATSVPIVNDDLVAACLDGDEAAARSIAEEAGSLVAYPSTKLAIIRWVRTQATKSEWAGSGITLNAVAPGVTETAMVAESRADPVIGEHVDSYPIPLGRSAQVDEVAGVIHFLLGPQARFFCGSIVYIDGGTDALFRPDRHTPMTM